VEADLHLIASMPYDLSPDRDRVLVALPANKVPLLIPGAFWEVSTWAFGFKISLCATLCYILYFSVDWPGISTSVTTVLIAGLSTTGALKQKFAFRLAGALIGGLFLGLGCTVFLFPHMDSITSLTVLVAILAFGAAWITAGRQFSYVGLQIIFAFYLVAFEDFRAPTQLAPARDRLIGILLALVVMWFVFDQMWPVRTVTAMRQALASILRSEVALFQLEMSSPPRQELLRQADTLRDHIAKTMAAIRTMNDEVDYEFGVDRERHIETANTIVRGGLTAVALIWNEIVMVHKEEDGDFPNNPQLVELRQRMIKSLSVLTNSVLQKTRLQDSGMSVEQTSALASAELLEDARYGEYAVHVSDRYRELESIVAGLEGQV